MANKMLEYYKELPSWAKGVVVVGGGAILFYVGYTVIRNLRKQAELKSDLEESNTAQSDLNKLKSQGVNPTLSDSQVDGMVNALVEAMNDCGTDETAVYNQFKKLNNLADVYLLIAKWKIRYYRPCGATQPISYTRYMFNNQAFGGNISTWLNYDMSQSEIAQINKILSDKKINYKF